MIVAVILIDFCFFSLRSPSFHNYFDSIEKKMTLHEGQQVSIRVHHNGYDYHEVWGSLMYTCAGIDILQAHCKSSTYPPGQA